MLEPVRKDKSIIVCGYLILCMSSGPRLETRNYGRLLQVKVHMYMSGSLTIYAVCQTLMSITTSSASTSSIIKRLIFDTYKYKL
jgi:hypothetical protein